APALDVAGQIVEAPRPLPAPTQILAQCLVGTIAGHDVIRDGRERLGQIHGRFQWIRTSGEAAVADVIHRRPVPPPSPSTASATGKDPRAPARSPPPAPRRTARPAALRSRRRVPPRPGPAVRPAVRWRRPRHPS